MGHKCTEDCANQSEAVITLKLDNFSACRNNLLSGPKCIRKLKWRMLYEPDGEYVSIYLKCSGPSDSKDDTETPWNCYVQYEIMLISQKSGLKNLTRKMHGFFHSKTNFWGLKRFVALKELLDPNNGFIQDDIVIFQVHVEADTSQSIIFHLPPNKPNISTSCKKKAGLTGPGPNEPLQIIVTNQAGKDNTSKVSKKLNEFRMMKVLCDVDIIINDSIFSCHRNVLASACAYFEAMFINDFEEVKKRSVTLYDFDTNTFDQILNFIYTGEITINHQNIYSILKSSDFLGLSYIEDLCMAYLEHNIPDSIIDKVCCYVVRKDYGFFIKSKLKPHIERNFAVLSNHLLNVSSDVLLEVLPAKIAESDANSFLNFISKWVKLHRKTQVVFQLLKQNDILTSVDVSELYEMISNIVEVEKFTDPSSFGYAME